MGDDYDGDDDDDYGQRQEVIHFLHFGQIELMILNVLIHFSQIELIMLIFSLAFRPNRFSIF